MSQTKKVKLKLFNWGYLLVNASERPILYSDYEQLKKLGDIRIIKEGIFANHIYISHWAVIELEKRGYKTEVVAVGN